jgi:hypothetical protein
MDAILTQDQLLAVNEKFKLDLDYSSATHYRAAQVIYKLWKATEPEKKQISEETPDASADHES